MIQIIEKLITNLSYAISIISFIYLHYFFYIAIPLLAITLIIYINKKTTE